MMKNLLLVVLVVLFIFIPTVTHAEDGIRWLTLDNALKEAKEEKKPVLVDFYAEWCGYCKKMKRETYSDRVVTEKINRLFKAVSIDIEGRKEFIINGKKVSEGEFSDGFNITSTPTTFFLKPTGEPIKGIPGFMEPEEFLPILSYISEGWYEKMGLVEYINKHGKR